MCSHKYVTLAAPSVTMFINYPIRTQLSSGSLWGATRSSPSGFVHPGVPHMSGLVTSATCANLYVRCTALQDGVSTTGLQPRDILSQTTPEVSTWLETSFWVEARSRERDENAAGFSS